MNSFYLTHLRNFFLPKYESILLQKPENARLLFDKSFSLISHMEPPDVLTGSYLLQILINLPSAKQVLLKYFLAEDIEDEIDIRYYCIRFLTKNLMEQVLVAKLDLMIAATCGPMYGTLFAIRLLFKDVNFHCFNLNGNEIVTKITLSF